MEIQLEAVGDISASRTLVLYPTVSGVLGGIPAWRGCLRNSRKIRLPHRGTIAAPHGVRPVWGARLFDLAESSLVYVWREEESERPLIYGREVLEIQRINKALPELAFRHIRLSAAQGLRNLNLRQAGEVTSLTQLLENVFVPRRMDRSQLTARISDSWTVQSVLEYSSLEYAILGYF